MVPLHLAAHFVVRDGLALIQGCEALPNLLLEPFVVVQVAGYQSLHDLVRSFAGLGSDSIQLGFEFRCK